MRRHSHANPGWSLVFWGIMLIAVLVIGIVLIFLQDTHLIHTWNIETLDGIEVKVCSKCGEIEYSEETTQDCTHEWSVRKEGDDFIAYCTNCGETKAAE